MITKEFRCKSCRKLLAKVAEHSLVEIKCNRCKSINSYQDNVLRREKVFKRGGV